MVYGYARVSTKGQDRNGNSKEVQDKMLRDAGATEVFYDSISGAKRHRPMLDELLRRIQPGDTVIVTKLDRIARSTTDGIEIIDQISNTGCRLNILNMGVFDDTPTGRLMRTVMLAFAEFERDMIRVRTQEGKAQKRLTDPSYVEGRPNKEIPDFEKFLQKQKEGTLSVTECCRQLGISRGTWYNRVRGA